MTGIFKANNPYNNFLLFLYGLVLKLPMFLYPVVPHPQPLDGVLYKKLLAWLEPAGRGFPWIYSMIAFALLYLQAIFFNKLLNDQRLLPRPNFLAGMSYLLITSLFPEWGILSAPLIINSLLIWVLANLFNLYNNPNAKTILFNVGLITGLASIFYFPAISFALLIIVGISITRPFKLPEWIITLIGILAAYYFLGAWFFLTGKWSQFKIGVPAVSLPVFHANYWAYLAILFVLITVVIGIFFVQTGMRRLVVQSRKCWSLIYLYLLVAIFVPFINAGHRFDNWIMLAVPASAFAASAFLFPQKRWFAVFVHWSLVAMTIVMGYFTR